MIFLLANSDLEYNCHDNRTKAIWALPCLLLYFQSLKPVLGMNLTIRKYFTRAGSRKRIERKQVPETNWKSPVISSRKGFDLGYWECMKILARARAAGSRPSSQEWCPRQHWEPSWQGSCHHHKDRTEEATPGAAGSRNIPLQASRVRFRATPHPRDVI